jgi:PhnB protein
MAKHTQSEQFDQLVGAILARPKAAVPRASASLARLGSVAAALRDLPRDNFRSSLKSDLQRRALVSSKPTAVREIRQSATAYLTVSDAAAAIEFYKKAFGAVEVMRLQGPGPRVGHAEIRVGNSSIYLADEFPEYGIRGPQSFGGSPIKMNLDVDDVDAFALKALAAGATVVRPIQDQFYGERSGQFGDPFGYTWNISTRTEDVTGAEMQRRMDSMIQAGDQAPSEAPPTGAQVNFIRKGFTTLTPYLVLQDAAGAIDFVKKTFTAEEIFRDIGSAGGIHCEVRVGDSMMMIGGGGPGVSWKGESRPMPFHVYVTDTDAAYRRALGAGATTLYEPADMPYGERSAGVKDPAGNVWYIATFRGDSYKSPGAPTVQPYMHPRRAEPVIRFLKQAFGAVDLGQHADAEGIVHHATIKIGDSQLELGEANGPYVPMPGMFYLYVLDADACYRRAIAAGGTSLYEPADMPYGDRIGGVKDPFGNEWCIATHIKDITA